MEAYLNRVQLSATGFYRTPKIHWDPITVTGRPFYYFAYGAAVTEVAIDLLTGENRVIAVDILHDVGRSLNPAVDAGQIEGGFIQGMGWLTTEELWWDTTGRLKTHAPSTYKIPTCSDRPEHFQMRIFEAGKNPEATIYRSKAVGEPPLMLALSVHQAIVDAISSVNAYRDLPQLPAPATPEAILNAVDALREREAA
jgi:xanthine dehydrogenase large subunit